MQRMGLVIGLKPEVIAEYKSRGVDNDARAEGRAAARYLGQLKSEITAHGAATLRLRERVRHIPLVGKFGVKLAGMMAKPRER